MDADTRSQLAAIARRWVEEGWRRGDGAIVDELHAAGFIDHDSGGRAPDNAGFRDGIVRLYAAFPDFHAEVRDLVIEAATPAAADPDATGSPAAHSSETCAGARAASGTVAVRWTATGTHRAAYLGCEPTERQIRFQGIEVIRIVKGRITERWGEWDGLGLLEQMR